MIRKVIELYNSQLQKLEGEWVQAFGAMISGIIWMDKP